VIAELVKQYDTLKRCGISIPDPLFGKEIVSVEVVLKADGAFRVNWIGPVENKDTNRKSQQELLADCGILVTEQSAGRTNSNNTPPA